MEGVNIIEAEVCIDHVHMLVEIPPKMRVSSFMEYLKGKSSLKVIEEYIKNQIQEDLAYEQMSLKVYIDQFTVGHDNCSYYFNIVVR